MYRFLEFLKINNASAAKRIVNYTTILNENGIVTIPARTGKTYNCLLVGVRFFGLVSFFDPMKPIRTSDETITWLTGAVFRYQGRKYIQTLCNLHLNRTIGQAWLLYHMGNPSASTNYKTEKKKHLCVVRPDQVHKWKDSNRCRSSNNKT